MLLVGIVLAAVLSPLAVHAREQGSADARKAEAKGKDRSNQLHQTEQKLRDAKDSADQLAADIAGMDDEMTRLRQQVADARTEDAVARGRAARAEAAIDVARASVSRSFQRHQLRARSAYMMGPAMQMSALVDARDAIELRDKALVLDYVSRASSEELLPLDVAQLRLNQAEYEAGLAEERVATTRTVLEQRGEELRKIRKARVEAKKALDQQIAGLQDHVDGLRLASASLTGLLKGRTIGESKLVGGERLSLPGNCPVTSPFGRRWGRMHEGIDFGCPFGHPVRAAGPGTVAYAGWEGGYGNLVVIDHGGGITTAYGHNSRLAVKVGETVDRGEIISYVGSTGHSTGPHIHFEVRVNGEPTDPVAYLV
jgi:murein DD-endopeptidase MepM/ murein hydrolase activator NlpD